MSARGEPALKGFVIQSLWEDLHGLMREGALARETAELRLSARDLDLLDGKIEPALWYPNETYVRYAQLLAEVAGVTDAESYWTERGRKAVERLLSGPSTVQKMVAGAKSFGNEAGRALMRLPELVLNYGEWSFERMGPSHWVVSVCAAEALPDSLRFSFQGAGERIAQLLSGSQTRVTSSRARLDTVRFEGRTA
jgi:hypothetical protein